METGQEKRLGRLGSLTSPTWQILLELPDVRPSVLPASLRAPCATHSAAPSVGPGANGQREISLCSVRIVGANWQTAMCANEFLLVLSIQADRLLEASPSWRSAGSGLPPPQAHLWPHNQKPKFLSTPLDSKQGR